MRRSKKKTISRKKKTVKKQKGGSNLQDITIGILSWNSCTTLRNSLESYKKNGLLSLIKSFIYFQEISDIEKQFANKYSVPYIGTEKNIGIQKAFIEMVNNTKTSYFIFAENDFELIHDMNETQKVLDDSLKLLDNDDVAIVKLRDKENPGDPLYSKGNYENDYKDKPTLQTFPYKLEALSFIESPETVFPNAYTIINYNYKWYKTSNTNNQWSNNIFIAKTSWLKENVLPLIDIEKNDTVNLYTFENNMIQNLKNYNIAAGIGLFKHNRLDRDDCTLNSIKLLNTYGGNYYGRGINDTRKGKRKRSIKKSGGANIPEPNLKIDGSKYSIVQYDNREITENHKKFMEINKEYCKKHNYSYKFFNYKDETLPVYWLKVKIVKELLNTDEYEGILWLDTDAVIKNTDKTLDSFGDTNTAFIMSNDQYPMEHDDLNKYPFNAGCWIVKNNNNGKLILSDWLNTYNPNSWKKNDKGNLRTNTSYGGDEYEQGMFVNKILPKYKDNILILPWYIFHAFDVSQNKDIFILHFCSNKTIEENRYLKLIEEQTNTTKQKAYVINLDERTDRWNKIQETFKNRPFNIERISGVKNEIGLLGCTMSFVKAVEKAKENNLPYILIMEDDCKPKDNLDTLWPTIKDWLEKNMDKWEIFIGGNTMYAFTNDTSSIKPLCKIDENIKLYYTVMSTAHFFCINSSVYDKYIDVKQYLTKELFQHDTHTSDRWPNTQKMKIVTPVPFIAIQEESHSDTTGKDENYTSMFDNSEKVVSSIENSISCAQNGGDISNSIYIKKANSIENEYLYPILKNLFLDKKIEFVTDRKSYDLVLKSHWDNGANGSDKYIFISPERYDATETYSFNDPNCIAKIFTTEDSNVASIKDSFYIPYFLDVGPFIFNESPMKREYVNNSRNSLAAYVARYSPEHRDLMFKALYDLDETKTTDGLGNANHTKDKDIPPRQKWWEISTVYKDYLFGFAMENTNEDGYITEKIMNVYRGGAIPIYWGTAKVKDIFNPESFVYVNDYPTFEDCAKDIIAISKNKKRLEKMQNAPIFNINSIIDYSKYFDTPSPQWVIDIADKIKEKLNLQAGANKNKLTVELKGGLGNRLFQIYAALGFAEKWDMDFYIPNSKNQRINHIPIDESFNEIKILLPNLNILTEDEDTSLYTTINEKEELVYNEYENPNNSVILKGYFQTEKYFPKNPPQLMIPEPENSIIKGLTNIYFIHIRLGDYLVSGALDLLKYHHYCINKINEIDSNARYIVVSDDISKAKEYIETNFKLVNVLYDESNKRLNSLYYISKCDGGIGANSTFSWFSAYSIRNKNKNTLFFPKPWFKNIEKELDIYPNWATIVDIDTQISY